MQNSDAEMGSECSMSYGALVQQSACILKNECAILEDKIGQKRKDIIELKRICATQAENIEKQQSELEHYKIKTHSEGIQNKSHMSKILNLREKLQVLDKNFEKWGQTINSMLGYKNKLEEISKQLKLKLEMKKNSSEQMETENSYFIEKANKALLELQERKEREKTELCQLKTHLSNQLEQQKLQQNELERELREQCSASRENKIKIDILEPQRAELKKTFETLKSELLAETDQINCSTNRLETTLHEALNRKTQISTDLDTVEKNINEMNNALREIEMEIKLLDNKQKKLNADEEESSKASMKKQQELQELETTVEELTSQYSAFMKIETENVTLKAAYDDLLVENSNYNNKIAHLSSEEEVCDKRIVELNQLLEELEIQRSRVANENLVVDEAIKTLEEEQERSEEEHRALRLKFEQKSAELQQENSLLKSSLQKLKEQILEANQNKDELEKTLQHLERELAEAETISKESYVKLANFNEKCAQINKHYEEEINTLHTDMQKGVEEFEKLVSDCKLNEEVKKDVNQLAVDLESYRVNYAETIQELQDSFAKEIENKKKLMEELRAQCEREYRNNEVKKTDALVELKETKARIIEFQKKKVSVEKEIEMKRDILKKCDNLIQRLTMKFNKVAEVAITSSQSVVDTVSQQQSFATPKMQRKPVKVVSPGSDSSGKTFDPDDVELKRRFQKRTFLQPLAKGAKPSKLPKTKIAPPPPKKKATEEKDDWGFD